MPVKVCGITRLQDAQDAVALGAAALGFVFAPSPRRIEPEAAAAIARTLPPWVATFGVFVDASADEVRGVSRTVSLSVVQLHGAESPEFCAALGLRWIKALRVQNAESLQRITEYHAPAILLDAYVPGVQGGTGARFDWDLAHGPWRQGRYLVLSGGLNPDNVQEALRQVQPDMVDVSSGVERSPGVKDRDRMEAFFRAVRGA